jgi:RTX calcium-binding nonapeptide repeat (4 copies)
MLSRGLLSAALALMALLPSPAVTASAAPVTVAYDAATGLRIDGTPGPDDVLASLVGTPAGPASAIRVSERDDGAVPGPGCGASGPLTVSCPLSEGASRAATVSLLGGDDVLELGGLSGAVDLGAGDDLMRAPTDRVDVQLGPGNDGGGLGPSGGTIDGGPGDDRVGGGPGDDRVLGGDGADRLFGSLGADALDGGAGPDTLTYARLTGAAGPLPSVAVLLGEGEVAKRVGAKGGGAGQDRLVGVEAVTGTPRADAFSARDGVAQRIACGAGADKVDLDLRDRLPALDDCEASARGAVGEVPNVTIRSARASGRVVAVTLRCPVKTGSIGCRGTLAIRRGKRAGPVLRYRLAAGRGATVRPVLPRGSGGVLRVVSVERGRLGKRTTIRTLANARASAADAIPIGQGELPAIGVVDEDVGETRQLCGRPNGFVVGFKSRSSLRWEGGFTILPDGVRAIEVHCAFMTEDGGLTGGVASEPILGEFYGGDFFITSARAPESNAACQLPQPLTGTVHVGVATGLFAELADGQDPVFVREFGLRCAFADNLDPILNDIGSNTSPDERPFDGERDCPPGSAVAGMRVGGDRTGRSADFLTIGVTCAPFPLPPSAPTSLSPGEGVTVTPSTGENFTWRRAAGAFHVCVTSVVPARCVRTTANVLPLTDLVTAADVGSRVSWSVRACNGRAQGSTPDFACGATSTIPTFHGPISIAVRVAPRAPTASSSSRPRRVGSGGNLGLDLSFRGGVFALRHRLTGSVDGEVAIERVLPEAATAWGQLRSATLAIPVPPGRHVVVAEVRACAGDTALPQTATRAEVCGARVQLARFLVDSDGDVCTFSGTTAPKACPTTTTTPSGGGRG